MPHDGHAHPHPPSGHNQPKRAAVQWQVPTGASAPPTAPVERDLDLVEAAFCEAATTTTDPTSLLRLARVPFIADLPDGTRIRLLGYAIEDEAEVGAVAPAFGAAEPVYHPLPAARVVRRRRLRFRYFAGREVIHLTLADMRDLADLTPPA